MASRGASATRQTSRCRPHWTRRLDQKLLGPATLLGLAVCRAGEPKSQPGGHSVTLVSESELRGALRHAGISNRRPCVVGWMPSQNSEEEGWMRGLPSDQRRALVQTTDRRHGAAAPTPPTPCPWAPPHPDSRLHACVVTSVYVSHALFCKMSC